jgi:hypothetical protein
MKQTKGGEPLLGHAFDASKAKLLRYVLFLGPLISSAIPRLTWLFLLLTGLGVIVPYIRQHGSLPDWRPLPAGVKAFLLLAAYVLVSAIWSELCPRRAYRRHIRPY